MRPATARNLIATPSGRKTAGFNETPGAAFAAGKPTFRSYRTPTGTWRDWSWKPSRKPEALLADAIAAAQTDLALARTDGARQRYRALLKDLREAQRAARGSQP